MNNAKADKSRCVGTRIAVGEGGGRVRIQARYFAPVQIFKARNRVVNMLLKYRERFTPRRRSETHARAYNRRNNNK